METFGESVGLQSGSIAKPEEWAESVYGGASLGDQRLNRRLVKVAGALAAHPRESVRGACRVAAEVRGAYRLVENKRVTAERLLEPTVRDAVKQCAGEATVLAIQDSSSLSYAGLKKTRGLGPITDSAKSRGMWSHTTMAATLDGCPLGLLDVQAWSRDPDKKGSRHQRRERPFQEKESSKWTRGMEAARKAFDRYGTGGRRPVLIHVGDREEDVHEVLQDVAAHEDEEMVVRCQQDRRVVGGHAFALVAASPVLGVRSVHVPRKGGRQERRAEVEIRAARITLKPLKRPHGGRRPVALTLVWVWEPNPPPGEKRLDWKLWTTRPVTDLESAVEVVNIYAKRWRIEDYHKVLKTGTRIESLQMESAETIQKMLMLYAAIAVSILRLTHLGRQRPESPCTDVLSQTQCKVLFIYVNRREPDPGAPAPTLAQALQWIGQMGGHMGRRRDGMPGPKTLWQGMMKLHLLTLGYELHEAGVALSIQETEVKQRCG